MFRFESPAYLWLLALIPLLLAAGLWAARRKRRRLGRFGDPALIARLPPGRSPRRAAAKTALAAAALALLAVALARPQMGSKAASEKRNGIETIIALDVSNSMAAEDVAPSRLMKSKLLVESLVDHFTNDKIGLVVFAGDAFVQLPITSDYVSAKMFLQGAEPGLIATQGTDIARAIELSMKSFTQQEKTGRAIIVITDGEDHEGGAVAAAKAARARGVNVFILGVGDTKGAPIPLPGGGHLADASGNTVMTALNEPMCRDIARAGSGTYIHVDNTNDAQERLNDALAKLQRGEHTAVIYSEYAEQFQAFALLALILLALETLLREAKGGMLTRVRIFKDRKDHHHA